MSQAIRCDCCKRSTPDINPKYSRCKTWQWWRKDDDSQGGSFTELDICEECWTKLGELVRK